MISLLGFFGRMSLAAVLVTAHSSCGYLTAGDVVYSKSGVHDWEGSLDGTTRLSRPVRYLEVKNPPKGISGNQQRAATIFQLILVEKTSNGFIPASVEQPNGSRAVVRGHLDYGLLSGEPDRIETPQAQFLVIDK